jgi:hypothetical protein
LDCFENLREFLNVFSDDGNAFLRIFPVFTDVLGTPGMLIVLELVIDIVRCLVWRDKPNVVRDMCFLGEVLDVQATIDNLSLIFAVLVEGNEPGSSKAVDKA